MKFAVRGSRAWALSFGVFFALSSVLVANRDLLNQRQAPVALSLLLVVLLGSVIGGRALGLALAFAGFLVINYFFQIPYGSLGIHDPADWMVLVTFVLTADVASRLLVHAKQQTAEAERRAAELRRIADLGAETLSEPISEQAAQATTDVIARTLGVDACEVWQLGENGDMRCLVTSPKRDALPTALDDDTARRLRAAAEEPVPMSIEERDRQFAAVFSGAPRDALLPLSAREHGVGVLRLRHARGLVLDESSRTFLKVLSYHVALTVERIRLVEPMRREYREAEARRLLEFALATVSHDLRTPLTTIKALANEIARSGDRNAAVIEEQADRLSRMVAGLLDLSQARSGVLALAREINTAEDVLGAALRQLRGVLGDHDVRTQLASDTGALVGHFDFVATLRVLVNLIENAAKYSPADAPIDVSVLREANEIVFSVADRGAGVPDEERERIFVPFHRAAGTPPDVGGTGLGLAVSRALAEAQGGSLDHAPRAGGGTVFTLRVPASDDAVAMELIGA